MPTAQLGRGSSQVLAMMLAYSFLYSPSPSFMEIPSSGGSISSKWHGARSSKDYVFEKKGARRVEEKHGRNEPCTCGSGLKYKKCCG